LKILTSRNDLLSFFLAFTFHYLVTFLAPITSGLWAQDKKLALATFYVSMHIGFSELGGNSIMAASIATLVDDPNFNLQPVLA
jgi:hypothetical protein